MHSTFYHQNAKSQQFKKKTQKALEMINHHQYQLYSSIKKEVKIPKSPYIIRHDQCKIIGEDDNIKIQLLPGSIEKYKYLNTYQGMQMFLMKIIVRKVTGKSFQLFINYQNNQQEQMYYKITKDKIIVIPFIVQKKFIYFTFKSDKQIVMFNFRIITQRKCKNIDQSNQNQILKLQNFKNVQKFQPINQKSIEKSKRKKSILYLKTQRVIQSSYKLMSQKQKHQLTKIKRQKINSSHSKYLQIIKITQHCRDLIFDFQKQFFQEKSKRIYIHKKIVISILLSKFIGICQFEHQNYENKIRKQLKKNIIIYKFSSKLLKKQQQSIKCISTHKNRQMVTLIASIANLSAIIYPCSLIKAQNILKITLQSCRIPSQTNLMLDYATKYRRKIRLIQKAWKNKYKAREIMIKMYLKQKYEQLIFKHKHFEYLIIIYSNQNIQHNLSYQYRQQQASQLKQLYNIYENTLKNIEKIKQVNLEIRNHNQIALKKHKKIELPIPKIPIKPIWRYFRNLQNLKCMLRQWFQLQHQKYIKKAKNIFTNKKQIKSQ